jgi:hypothetical protein
LRLCIRFRSGLSPARERKPGACCMSDNRDGAGLGRRAHLDTAPIPVGQICRSAPISPPASGAKRAAEWTKHHCFRFPYNSGGAAAPPYPGVVSSCALGRREHLNGLDEPTGEKVYFFSCR